MIPFRPAEERWALLRHCGYSLVLADKVEEVKARGALGSYASAYLNTAVKCLLVGFDEPARQVLQKAHEWLLLAIATNEKSKVIPAFKEESDRFHSLAMCNWLLYGQHDRENLKHFVIAEDRNLASDPSLARDKINVSFLLPSYANAEAYERALELFSNTRKAMIPKSLKSIRTEGQMAYVYCRYRLGLEYTETEVQQVLARFFRRSVDGWLGHGHYLSTAEWMKIAYWREGGALSPKETVLKCYDYLPPRD